MDHCKKTNKCYNYIGGDKLIGIILGGHGQFAEGLGSTMEMLIGPQENFEKINFNEDMSIEELREIFEEKIEKLNNCKYILILTDVFGGSPFKEGIKQAYEKTNIYNISGINTGLLIEAVLNRNISNDMELFVKNLILQGREAIIYGDMEKMFTKEEDNESL